MEWKDGTTAWVGIHDLSSAAQQHVRLRMHGKLDSDNERTKKKKMRRKSLIQAPRNANAAAKDSNAKCSVQRRRETQERAQEEQKKKESEELDAKISMSLRVSVVNSEFSGAMLGDADDAKRLMEFIIKRWGDEAKADAAAAEHFPSVPSDETLAARVNEFFGTHVDRGKHQCGLRCVRRVPSSGQHRCVSPWQTH